jgi:hypothetical protein
MRTEIYREFRRQPHDMEDIFAPAGSHSNLFEVVKTSTATTQSGEVKTFQPGTRILAWLTEEMPDHKDWSWALAAKDVHVRYRMRVESLRPGVLVAVLSE